MTSVRFSLEARHELRSQVVYYETAKSGLGRRFLTEIRQGVKDIARYPSLGQPFKQQTRRVFAKTFPFSIVYIQKPSEVIIIAIAHVRRKPGYWLKRINDAS